MGRIITRKRGTLGAASGKLLLYWNYAIFKKADIGESGLFYKLVYLLGTKEKRELS
jgi:hypothetical protein